MKSERMGSYESLSEELMDNGGEQTKIKSHSSRHHQIGSNGSRDPMKDDLKALTSQHSKGVSLAENDSKFLAEMIEVSGLDAEDVAPMIEAARNGESWHHYTGFSLEASHALQDVAATHFNARRYDEAEAAFRSLNSLHQGSSASVWRGLGACRYGVLDFDGAIECFSSALMRDLKDHLSYVWLAECLMLANRQLEAISVLETMLQLVPAGDSGTEAHLKRAQAMLQTARQGAQEK